MDLQAEEKGETKGVRNEKMNINNPRKLNESEYEELIRLRAEITYIKAENEAIKKRSP